MVVRGDAPARERARVRREQGARTDRDQLDVAAREALAAQPVQQVLRLGGVGRDGVARQADQHHPARAVPLRRQRRQPRKRDADRAPHAGPRPREFDDEVLGLPRRAQPLVGDAQRLGRPGPVEHQAVGQEHENYADGGSLRVHV
ncbi:hypothetical protein D9M70_576060 [compost metagenome]